MTILIVPSWYKTSNNPNLGSYFYEQAKMLKQNGFDVIIADATLQDKKSIFSKRNYIIKDFYDSGIRTITYVSPSYGFNRFESIGIKLYKRNLNKIINYLIKKGTKIDIIHAHSFYPAGYVSCEIGKLMDIPVAVTEHNSLVLTKNINNKRLNMLKRTVNAADSFICVSDALKKSVEDLTSYNNIRVIPNVVDDIFNYKELNNEKFSFVSIGNLISSKRFDLTIDAFKGLLNVREDCMLYIVGTGCLKDDLVMKVKNFKIEDKVVFTGRLSRQEVSELYRKMNCMVLPSDFETFGLVYIESLASGRPVIATKNGGANEIVSQKNGMLIELNNIQQLKDAMIYVYDNYEKYNKRQISIDCFNQYGQSSICALLKEVYISLIKKR